MNYATNVTSTMAADVRKLPEVQSEVEQIGFQLDYLDKAVERLTDRLASVVGNRAVECGANLSTPEPVRVPLADILHQRYLMLVSITRRIDELTERVEL